MVVTYDKNPRLTETERLDSLAMSIQLALNEKADKDTVSKTYATNSSLLGFFYPVGSYYETSDALFDPNNTWGGVWELEAEGLVHIGAGANYAVGATGGEATHTLTVDEIPSHTHKDGTNASVAYAGSVGTNTAQVAFDANSGRPTTATGGGQAHNNMQPYTAVNRWHRVA